MTTARFKFLTTKHNHEYIYIIVFFTFFKQYNVKSKGQEILIKFFLGQIVQTWDSNAGIRLARFEAFTSTERLTRILPRERDQQYFINHCSNCFDSTQILLILLKSI